MDQPPQSPEMSTPSEASAPPKKPEAFSMVPVDKDEAPLAPWWKRSSKAALGLSVFAILSVGILAVTHMLAGVSGHDMGGHDMGGMDHDMGGMDHGMGGMSHDDMMTVDGAFNATPVTVDTVQPTQLDVSVNYTGAIYPYSEVTVYPRVAGQLSNYEIYPGDRVTAGQTLATLDALERVSQTGEADAAATALLADVEASLSEVEEQKQQIGQVEADLEYLRLQRDRFADLTAAGATPQDQYDLLISQVAAKESMLQGARAKLDRLQAQVTSDQAQANRAQSQLEGAAAFEGYTQITSPISGVVQARMADPGVVVQPGTGIFKIGDYQRVRLRANVAQQDASRIQVGTPITAQVPGAEAAGVIRGEITSIFPQTDLTTRTVTVEAVVDNPNGQLLSGQFLDMEIITERRADALSVPQKALVAFNGEPAVWVVNGERAQRRQVATGLMNRGSVSEGQGQRVEITSGLKDGDRVITSGYSRLQENSAITIVDSSRNTTDSFVSVP
ncbi:MAG: efflux RND transporter periplasmic adaptor subunit [Cyanobacteria bacterium J06559_1]